MRWLQLFIVCVYIPALRAENISKTDARTLIAFKEMKSTSPEKAADLLLDALKKGDSPFLRYELGLLYASTGKQADAIEAFQKVLKSQPDFPGATRNLAILLSTAKRYPEAINVLTDLAKRRDLGAELNLLLGEAYSVEGNDHAALQCFYASLPAYPDEMGIRLKIAESLYRMDRFEESAGTALAVIKQDASLPEAWVIRGNCSLKQGNLSRAIDCFEAARLLDSTMNKKLLPVLGNIYLSQNMPRLASECYNQSGITAMPQQLALARAFYNDDEIEQATSIINELSAKGTPPKEAQLLTALLKLKSGDVNTAETLLSAYIKNHPLDGEALISMAAIATRKGRNHEAISWYKAARQAGDWKRFAMESELDIYLQAGNDEGALLILNELKLAFPSPQWDELERQLR